MSDPVRTVQASHPTRLLSSPSIFTVIRQSMLEGMCARYLDHALRAPIPRKDIILQKGLVLAFQVQSLEIRRRQQRVVLPLDYSRC